MKKIPKGKAFSYRLRQDHEPRIAELCNATERDKSFFIDKALEAFLPELEKRHAQDLEEYRRKQGHCGTAAGCPGHVVRGNLLNDKPASRGGASSKTQNATDVSNPSDGEGNAVSYLVDKLHGKKKKGY